MYRFLQCTVEQYMTSDVQTVARTVTMRELGLLFEQTDFNAFPVTEGGRLIGLVTKFDILRLFAFTTGQLVPHYEELMNRTVADAMTEGVVHVEPTMHLTRVLQMMVTLRIRSFPVVAAESRLMGIISRGDIARALRIASSEEEAQR